MRSTWNVKRSSLIKAGLFMVLAGLVVVTSGPSAHPEAAPLKELYGPAKNSRHDEEWIVRDFFRDRRDGRFVDVGANHYRKESNTYFLEKELGWSGLAIEPLTDFEAGYVEHRPRTTFLPFFVSDRSGESATLHVLPHNSLVSSSDPSFVNRHGRGATDFKTPTITLNDLLDRAGMEAFDFLNMDIELSEPKALAGFDVNRFRPQLVCIEAHPEVRQQILDYFTARNYVVVGKYLRADQDNLYFTPLAGSTRIAK